MKRKIIILCSVLVVLLGFYAFDYIRSTMFHITLVSLSPEQVPADGQTKVTIEVRLTDSSGNPVENHSLYAFPKGGGSFVSNREFTEKDGTATFTYYPYQLSPIVELKDVQVNVIDESNSIIFEINSKLSFPIKMIKGEDVGSDDNDLSGIFGE